MRAARALLGIDQRELAQRSGLSLPTIQRMEACDGVVRGNVDSLMKLIDALAADGIELIGEGASSGGGLFAGSYAVVGGVKDVVPVDLTIPGCPPNPRQLLAGLLALLQNAA